MHEKTDGVRAVRENRYMAKNNTFSDEVLAVCAVNATLKTEGVSNMAGGMYDALSKNVLGRESAAKGTKVSRSGEETAVDVSVIVDYGCNIPSVAWEIQENVKEELRHMVDVDVTAVNIHVQGVSMKSDEDDLQQEPETAGQEDTIIELQDDKALEIGSEIRL